jgi:HD-GYP domain-containing protein (c-di-GMP phosphodiesterase class II)
VYRPARDRQAALVELDRCAGTQFDPAIVKAFAEAVEDGTIGRERTAARASSSSDNGTREFETVA